MSPLGMASRLSRRSLLTALLGTALPSLALGQSTPQRVVSAAGSLTEIIFALGAERSLVGVDTTSLHPEATKTIAKIGYMRQLSAEGILALRPDLIVATPEAGPPNVLRQLTAAGARLEILPAGHGPDILLERIRLLSRLLQRSEEGERLAQHLQREFAELARARQQISSAPRVMFILSHGGSPQIAGHDTAAAAMIELAGGRLAGGSFSGYRPLTPESATAMAPDVILTTTQGIQALGGIDKLLALPGLALTPAGRARRVLSFEALYLLGFGPRTASAARELMQALRASTNT